MRRFRAAIQKLLGAFAIISKIGADRQKIPLLWLLDVPIPILLVFFYCALHVAARLNSLRANYRA